MAETDEIVQAVERLQGEFEDLTVRGLHAAGAQHLKPLAALREEFQRVGADHLAGRIGAVIDALRNGEPQAAAALMRAQASLRVFERVLTLEAAAQTLRGLLPAAEEGA